MCRISNSMTAGKRMKQPVVRGWVEVRAARETCWGGVTGATSHMKACRKCKRSGEGDGHGTLASQTNRKEAPEAGGKEGMSEGTGERKVGSGWHSTLWARDFIPSQLGNLSRF